MAVSELIQLLGIALAGTGLPLGLLLIRRWGQRRLDQAHATVEVTFPRDLDHAKAARVWTALSGLFGRVGPLKEPFGRNTIVFEVLSTPDGLHFLLSFPPSLRHTIESHLTGVIRDIFIEEATVRLDYDWRYVVALKRDSLIHDPDAKDEKDLYKQRPIDPKMVEVLLRSTRQLNQNEAVIIQFVMTPTGRLRDNKYPEFWAVGRIAASADYQDAKLRRIRTRQLIDAILSAYRALHVFTPGLLPRRLSRYVNERRAAVVKWPGTYIPEELAVMCGLPIDAPQVPGLVLGRRKLAPDAAYPRKGVIIGEATYPGAQRPIAMLPHGEVAHQHIMGKTGRGKTVQIVNQILQVVEQGYGAALIDPTGDTIKLLLDRWPEARVDDVILLDLTDSTMPVGFNVLTGNPAFVTNQVMAVFDRTYGGMKEMAQTNNILRSTLLTLAHKGYTLLDIPALLAPTPRGRQLREKLTGDLFIPALMDFWPDYEAMPDNQKRVQIKPVLDRLAPFATWDSLRGSLGQAKPRFSFDQAIATSKVILVNLNTGEIGEEENQLFGSLFFAQFWAAARRRSKIAPEKRKPYFLYIDEFQNYVRLPVSFETILDEARKFRVSLTVAHHRLKQLGKNTDLHEAVMGNAMSKLIFDVRSTDRPELARELPPTVPDDFVLRRYEAVAQLVVDNDPLPPVTIRTLPPRPPVIVGTDAAGNPITIAGRVRAASQRQYGKPMEDVELEIAERRRVAEHGRAVFGREEDLEEDGDK